MADTSRNLHQLLKGKQLYSALYGVCTEVLHDLTAVLKENVAKGETAKTTITTPLPIEESREQRRRKLKPTDDTHKKKTKKNIHHGSHRPQLRSKPDIGIIRGSNLVAVRPTTVQLTNCNFRVVT
jgi:hypothetical protein